MKSKLMPAAIRLLASPSAYGRSPPPVRTATCDSDGRDAFSGVPDTLCMDGGGKRPRIRLGIYLGENRVHQLRGQENLAIRNRHGAALRDASVELIDQFLHAGILVQLLPEHVDRIASRIAQVLARVDDRRKQKGEIALVTAILMPHQAAAHQVDADRLLRPANPELVQPGLDLRGEAERGGGAALIPDLHTEFVDHVLTTEGAKLRALRPH